MLPMGGGQPRSAGSCVEDLKLWWKNFPFASKQVFIIATCFYAISFFFNWMLLTLMPLRLFQAYNFWAFITSPFMHPQLLTLAFSLFSVNQFFKYLEQVQGSVGFFLDLLLKNIIFQIGYMVIIFALSFAMDMRMQFSCGLWNSVLYYITLRSTVAPEQETPFLCCPFLIKQKYYPWIIFALFFIFGSMGGRFQFDLLIAIITGLVEGYYYDGKLIKISKERLKKIQSSFLCSSFTSREDFVSVDSVQQGGAENIPQGFSQPANNPQPQQQQEQPKQDQFKAFGGKGTSLGGDNNSVPYYKQQDIESGSTADVQIEDKPDQGKSNLI